MAEKAWSSGMKAVLTRRAMIWGWCYSSRQISQQPLLLRSPKNGTDVNLSIPPWPFTEYRASASGCHLISRLVKYLNRGRGLLKVQSWFLAPVFSERTVADAGANRAASILMWAINETWRWGNWAWTNMDKHFGKVLWLTAPALKNKHPHLSIYLSIYRREELSSAESSRGGSLSLYTSHTDTHGNQHTILEFIPFDLTHRRGDLKGCNRKHFAKPSPSWLLLLRL